MKKLITLLFCIIIVFTLLLTGCSNSDTFTQKLYTSGDAEIEKVTIQVADRELEFLSSEDNQIYIDYYDGEKEYLDISVSSNKELIIKLATNKNWTDFIGTKAAKSYRKIQIKVPNNLLAALSVSTTNEDIKINELSFKQQVDLKTEGGNVECKRVNVGKSISLTAKNGDISGSIIGGWDDFSISCQIKKGDCNLPTNKEGGEKTFTANCNNGNINIQFVK